MTLRKFAGLGALLSLVMPSLAMAADEVAAPVLNSGDTAWMLTSTLTGRPLSRMRTMRL